MKGSGLWREMLTAILLHDIETPAPENSDFLHATR